MFNPQVVLHRANPGPSVGSAASELASARDVRRAIQAHLIYLDDEVVFWQDNPTRIFAESVVFGPTESLGLSQDDQQQAVAIVKRMRDHDEANVMDALVPYLFPLPEVAFGRANLAKNRDVEFRPGSVPNPEDENTPPALRLSVEMVGALGTPKPSLAFGYPDSSFDQRQASINDIYPDLAGLSRGLQHPFFFVQWKSSSTGGTAYDAQNQAMRTGAALVNARVDLCELASPLATPSSSDACVFSATIDSYTATTYIHWCATDESGNRNFHMNSLSDFILGRQVDIWRLQREIDNIMEWGLGRRLARTRAILDMIFERIL
ncbi:MAG: hypothetical protein M1813_000647 [Trichoglossum hirsutum]|jgi:hypothetical protein|nr:MAG: hypothetical protein M1813_000647 [Trichoglossum hirsutum]